MTKRSDEMAAKRPADDEGDDLDNKKTKTEDTGKGKPKSFLFIENVASLSPSEVFEACNEIKETWYRQNLHFVATERFSPVRETEIAMHIRWIMCRNLSAQDYVHIKYAESRDGKPNTFARPRGSRVNRIVITLQMMIELVPKDENSELYRKLAEMLVDYLMLAVTITQDLSASQEQIPELGDWFNTYTTYLEETAIADAVIYGKGVKATGGASSDISRQIARNPGPAIKIEPGVRKAIEALVVNPSTVKSLDRIAGQEAGKKALKTAIISTLDFHEAATYLDEDILCKGILLHGPPGTGKTALALAAACERNCRVLRVNSSNILDKFVGSTEKNLRALFAIADENRPTFLFLDECEQYCRHEDSELVSGSTVGNIGPLLMALMSQYPHVTVIGATSVPWQIDTAFLRRFEKIILLGLPDKVARKELIEIQLGTRPHCLTSGDIDRLVEISKNFSGDAVVRSIADAAQRGGVAARHGTHFRPMSFAGREWYVPCAPSAIGCIAKTFDELGVTNVAYAPLTMEVLEATFLARQQSRQVKELSGISEKHVQWSAMG